MELLMLGDAQESMIEKYLHRGVLFALYDDFDLKTVAVVTKEDNETCEIKNIVSIYQGKGYGSSMMKHIIQHYKSQCKRLIVDTGENEKALLFYEKLGFVYSHTIQNMVYFKLEYK